MLTHLMIKGSTYTAKCLPSDMSIADLLMEEYPLQPAGHLVSIRGLCSRTTSDHLQESWMEKFLHKFVVYPINSF